MAKTHQNDRFLAFRFPEFRALTAGSFLFSVALLMQEVIIGYEVYKLTGDPLSIGLLGLAQAVPFIGLSLFGGHFADIMSKRKMLMFSLLGIVCCSSALFFASLKLSGSQGSSLFQIIIYAVVFFTGTFYAFYSPTVSALRAFVVPRHAYQNAATWSSAAWHIGGITGAGASGFVYNWVGFSGTILTVAGIYGLSILSWSFVKDRKTEQQKEGSVWQKIREGLHFVRRTRMLFYSISLDLFSVLFGGVVAILPVFAEDILHVGAEGLGLLRAAPAVGGILMLFFIANISLMKNAWRTLLIYVAGFGLATVVFALSENFYLSIIALFLTGAFDSVSMVIRGTIMQLLTPDEMRGRVSSVNGIFISASNELGAFESGLAASLMGTVPSVVFGGMLALGIVGWVWWQSRDLLEVDLRKVV